MRFKILTLLAALLPIQTETPFMKAELIFPLEHWHNHASCIVETPSGDLLVCWFHGSGERTADDVKIEGARRRKGAVLWNARFTMADTPAYPDTNCTMFIDPQSRLWLLWPTILANEWETALMKYKISSDFQKDGPPRWEVSEVLHVTPGKEFEETVLKYLPSMEDELKKGAYTEESRMRLQAHLDGIRKHAVEKLYRRLGW